MRETAGHCFPGRQGDRSLDTESTQRQWDRPPCAPALPRQPSEADSSGLCEEGEDSSTERPWHWRKHVPLFLQEGEGHFWKRQQNRGGA